MVGFVLLIVAALVFTSLVILWILGTMAMNTIDRREEINEKNVSRNFMEFTYKKALK